MSGNVKDYKVCGYSATGKSHEDKGIKCQDFCFYKQGNGFIVAAVADGLSSSKHSDIASRMAAEISVMYCVQNIRRDDEPETILASIRKAFDDALFNIKQKSSNSPNDYDTTLTLVVFINGSVFYGQIGDSGMVALREDGTFERITEAQNGEGIGKDRPVYPLAAKSQWIFKEYTKKAKALFLATDGVLKIIEPPLLEKQQYRLNHKYLSYVWNKLDLIDDVDVLNSWIKKETLRMSPEEVDYDDKTFVFVSSNKVKLHIQSTEYYKYPTDKLWEEINNKYRESLYTSDPSIETSLSDRGTKAEPAPISEPIKQTEAQNSNPLLNHQPTKISTRKSLSRKKDASLKIFFVILMIEIIIALIIFSIVLFKRSDVFRPSFNTWNKSDAYQEKIYPPSETSRERSVFETDVIPSDETRTKEQIVPILQQEKVYNINDYISP